MSCQNPTSRFVVSCRCSFSKKNSKTTPCTRTRYVHAGVYTKRLKVPSLKQAGGQGLTAPHWRCSRTKRAEHFTVAQCETESGAVSKSNYQSHSNFEVASCMTYCTGYSVFCSIPLCHYVDNEVCWHVIIQVVSSFQGNWTCEN